MKNLYQNLPSSPGVYLMKDGNGEILYVGKAANLKRRVSSYFLRPQDSRIENLLPKIHKIDYKVTETALEALILEAELIKKYEPPFNVKDKDNKSFLHIEITKEKFPRVILVRGREAGSNSFGPFTSASSIREALRIIRRIFSYNIHSPKIVIPANAGIHVRPCFDYEIGLCPGTCIGAISRPEYMKTIRNIKLFFKGKKARIIKNLKKEMQLASKIEDFEKAEKIKRQIFALQHVEDTAFINENPKLEIRNSKLEINRMEGYDISNISGTSSVGSMVVFENFIPNKNEYRKFKIRSIFGSNDVGMLKEVLFRRFKHDEWPLPNLILIDGGLGQVNGARQVLNDLNLKIPVVGISKGAKRKRNDFIGGVPSEFDLLTLIKVRDEAHRFAISYHKKVRDRNFLTPNTT